MLIKSSLYTKMKVFHFKDKVDSLTPDKDVILAPVHIRIKPTNICNHRCSYCAYRTDYLQLGKDMVLKDQIPRGKMLEIVDDIIEMGVKAVTFSGGGEPFCYPYLPEISKKLADSSVRFASLTNGAKLEGEAAEIFAHRATWLRVSMDGWDDESYKSYRGVSGGEYTKIMSNMRRFKKFGGKCFLGISLIVDKCNASHIYEFIEKAVDVGVDSIKIAPCIISNEGSVNNCYHQPFFLLVKEQVERAKKNLAGDHLEINDSYHELESKFKKSYNWCPYLQILPIIAADLNVYSCQDKAYNLDCGLIGSIKEMRFKDFWFKDKPKFFKIDPSKDCGHHCVADGKNKIVLEYLSAHEEHLGFV